MVSSALNDGIVRLNDTFDCEHGRFHFAGRVLHDHESAHAVEHDVSPGGVPATWFANFAALGVAQRHLQTNLNPELTLDILGLRLQRQGTPHDYR